MEPEVVVRNNPLLREKFTKPFHVEFVVSLVALTVSSRSVSVEGNDRGDDKMQEVLEQLVLTGFLWFVTPQPNQ